MTDDGEGFIKSINNQEGARALITELIAAELGTWIGLKIPDFAIIRNCEIEITASDGRIMEPPFFFSKMVEGESRDFGGDFIRKLRDPYEVTKLVVFDTWIRNFDRYVESRNHSNDENILYSISTTPRKYEIVAIDHTHCVSPDNFMDEGQVEWLAQINDERIYGRFPEFLPFITTDTVAASLRGLAELDSGYVLDVVNSIPVEWGLTEVSKAELVNFFCQRAEFLVQNVSFNLLTQPDLPFMGS